MKLSTAQGKIRSTRGASYLTKGSDDFDHKGFKKANRSLSHALIEEQLDEKYLEPSPDFRYVLYKLYMDDDDNKDFGDWLVVGVFKHEVEMYAYFNELGNINFFIDGVFQSPKGFDFKYIDINEDDDALIWLDHY
jgi:hypothetical protein